jgi:hypothetical protein
LLHIRRLKRDGHLTKEEVLAEIQNLLHVVEDDSDSESESDDENDDKQLDTYNIVKIKQPQTLYRYVHRLNGKISLSKMKTDQSYGTYFLKNYADVSDLSDASESVVDDSDFDNDDDDDDIVTETQSSQNNLPIEQKHNLDDIREKILEHDRQQVRGIQLANAGANNLKVINNYSVTSQTCMLM